MEQEKKLLKDLLAERAGEKGLNLEKILQATEIPKHYLQAMFAGEWKKLPAAPYTRGYLKKLCPLLDLQYIEVWDLYENEAELVRASGAGDRLPENRFAITRKGYKWAWPVLAVTLIAGYLSLNLSRLVGIPELNVNSPLGASIITMLPNFIVSGQTSSRDKLFINSEEVLIDKDGRFQKNYMLQPGLNTFEIMAKRFLGRENKVVKQIIYQPQQNEKGR